MKRIQKPIREYTDYQREYRQKYRTLKTGAPIYDINDYVPCLICKKLFILLSSHVFQTHGIKMREYRIKFGLNKKKGTTAGKFKKLKSQIAKQNVNALKGLIQYKKGDKRLNNGTFKRSAQTIKRLKKLANALNKAHKGFTKSREYASEMGKKGQAIRWGKEQSEEAMTKLRLNAYRMGKNNKGGKLAREARNKAKLLIDRSI